MIPVNKIKRLKKDYELALTIMNNELKETKESSRYMKLTGQILAIQWTIEDLTRLLK